MNEKLKRYKLKEYEEWEDDAFYHYPHYCPNCGKPLSSIQSYWDDSSRPSTPENPFRGIGYDCYCDDCHWSGDIIPDKDRGIIEKRNELMKYKRLK